MERNDQRPVFAIVLDAFRSINGCNGDLRGISHTLDEISASGRVRSHSLLVGGIDDSSAGVLLHVAPLRTRKGPQCLGDTLSSWQVKLIHWAFALSWPLLGAKVFNAWWGTRRTLPTAAEAAFVPEQALWWQEFIMIATHYVSAFPQVAVVSRLFCRFMV